MSADLKALAIEYNEAVAAGDRPRIIAIFRKIREVIGALSPEQLQGGLALLKQLFDVFFPGTDTQSLATVLSADEVESLGFGANATQLVELIVLLMSIVRRLRAA